MDALERGALVNKDLGDLQLVHIRAFIVLGVCDGGLKQFLDDRRTLLRAEGQLLERTLNRHATNLISDQTAFCGEMRAKRKRANVSVAIRTYLDFLLAT